MNQYLDTFFGMMAQVPAIQPAQQHYRGHLCSQCRPCRS